MAPEHLLVAGVVRVGFVIIMSCNVVVFKVPRAPYVLGVTGGFGIGVLCRTSRVRQVRLYLDRGFKRSKMRLTVVG